MPLSAFPKCFLEDLVIHKTITVEQWIGMAADSLDIDGLEFFWGFVPHESPAELQQLKPLLAPRNAAASC